MPVKSICFGLIALVLMLGGCSMENNEPTISRETVENWPLIEGYDIARINCSEGKAEAVKIKGVEYALTEKYKERIIDVRELSPDWGIIARTSDPNDPALETYASLSTFKQAADEACASQLSG